MTIDDRTPNRDYTLPASANQLADDVLRLRSALAALDSDVASVLAALALKAALDHGHTIDDISGLQAALDAKADQAGGTTYAPINSPIFTGSPQAPTPSQADSSQRIATTSFVAGLLAAGLATKAALVHGHTADQVSGLATVAKTGSYADLGSKPTLGSAAAKAAGASAGQVLLIDDDGDAVDAKGKVRRIPAPNPASGSLRTLTPADSGTFVPNTAGGWVVPSGVLAANDTVCLLNTGTGSQTIQAGSGLTLRLAGTNNAAGLGNRALAPNGVATIWFKSATEAFIMGPGVS